MIDIFSGLECEEKLKRLDWLQQKMEDWGDFSTVLRNIFIVLMILTA